MANANKIADPAQLQALDLFHPVIRQWFLQQVGAPTPVQSEAWPLIAKQKHVLAIAPTGSGKTLTAFLWALNQWCIGAWPPGKLGLIYVSPLKALGSDVQRNLIEPLEQMREMAQSHNLLWPTIRTMTRTGDTPQAERQRMLRKPPEILITTPESLNLLLLNPAGPQMLRDVQTVILDEIHAVAESKRGVYLMTAVERLARIAGEFQRIALSATVQPLGVIARFVAGSQHVSADIYAPRPIEIVHPPASKVMTTAIVDPHCHILPEERELADKDWRGLVRLCRTHIGHNRSTLLFTSSRNMTEKLANGINDAEQDLVAYSHHGSLSRALRHDVEIRLKKGEIKALCSTSSLELGIDIGSLDEVLLIRPPKSIASCIQRIGRAGHQVGAPSHGTLVPLSQHDLLICMALAPQVKSATTEKLRPLRAPLDVLIQVLLAMCVADAWKADDLFVFIRTCDSYRDLTRVAFDLALDVLLGRYAQTNIRELAPKLRQDEDTAVLQPRAGVRRWLYQGSGVIADRGYFSVRTQDSKARIGELDEEFVWERKVGDRIVIGTQTWTIAAMNHSSVEVLPAKNTKGLEPFWIAESQDRGLPLSLRIGELVRELEPQLEHRNLVANLQNTRDIDAVGAQRAIQYLRNQRQATGKLPHDERVVLEVCMNETLAGSPSSNHVHVILHAPWGGRLLRPWAIALAGACAEHFQQDWRFFATDDAIGFSPPADIDYMRVLQCVTAETLGKYLRQTLGSTAFFGTQFRLCASNALLLPRTMASKRTPLWLTRERCKSLLNSVGHFDEFALIAETWRTCLDDLFDLDDLRDRLGAWQDNRIETHVAHTSEPSPFARELVQRLTTIAMYDDDTPSSPGVPLSERVLRDVARQAEGRPRVAPELAQAMSAKLQRTWPGYAPADAAELLDFLNDRLLTPHEEFLALLQVMQRDHNVDPAQMTDKVAGKVHFFKVPGAVDAVVAGTEPAARVAQCLGLAAKDLEITDLTGQSSQSRIARAMAALAASAHLTPESLLLNTLRFYGPVQLAKFKSMFGRIADPLAALIEIGQIATGQLIAHDANAFICLMAHLERLLRTQRAASRSPLQALPVEQLPLFLAEWQGLTRPTSGRAGVLAAVEQLAGLGVAADLWEREILPARVIDYQPVFLDGLMQETGLMWLGAGPQQVLFCGRNALELYAEIPQANPQVEQLLPDRLARYDWTAIQTRAQMAEQGSKTPAHDQIWQMVWQGSIASDAMAALRQGLLSDFKASKTVDLHPRRWQRGLQVQRAPQSTWQRTATRPPDDLVEAAERDKERVRQLLDRYGILFREILQREQPLLQWRRLLPTLRLLELAGEVVIGHFFEGIDGLQFAAPRALQKLQKGLNSQAICWMHAHDPASCAGMGIEKLRGLMPARLRGTSFVLRGSAVVLLAKRNGASLELSVGSEDPDLPTLLRKFTARARRAVEPVSLQVATINGKMACHSPYRAALLQAGFEPDMDKLVFYRKDLTIGVAQSSVAGDPPAAVLA